MGNLIYEKTKVGGVLHFLYFHCFLATITEGLRPQETLEALRQQFCASKTTLRGKSAVLLFRAKTRLAKSEGELFKYFSVVLKLLVFLAISTSCILTMKFHITRF